MELREKAPQSQPILNAPLVLQVLIGFTVLFYAVMQFLPSSMQDHLLFLFALFPARYGAASDGVVWSFPGGWLADLWSPLTYVFLHGSWAHLILNMVSLLAFGTPVARRLGTIRFLLFYFVCGIAGALTHLALHAGDLTPVVGASAAIAGLMAGAARFIFVGGPGLLTDRHVPRAQASIKAALRNRSVLIFVGVWIGVNFLFGPTGLNPTGEAASIAWEAHLGGFFAGLLLFGLFDPIQASPSGGPGNVNYGEWRGRQD